MLSFLISILLSVHPLFVSVIDMKHNTSAKNIEVSVRVFSDDLEAALSKNYNTKVDVTKNTNDKAVNSLISKYVQQKLQISVDGKIKEQQYVGYEIQKESVWIFVEFADVAAIKKLNVTCSFLYDFQEKQSNIFNVRANGSEKNYKLDNPKNSVEFSW